MPLHRNKSSQEKTLICKGGDTFVKENHILSIEKVTVSTQESSDPRIGLTPEFIFKGKGTRVKVEVGNDVR